MKVFIIDGFITSANRLPKLRSFDEKPVCLGGKDDRV